MLPRIATLLACLTLPLTAEPLLNSWHTNDSGQYARIYETLADQNAQNAVTVWTHPTSLTGQALPVYAGVHEISYTDTTVYIRTSGLGFHVMGPWYGNEEKTNLFGNYPANTSIIYSLPLDPGTPPISKTQTGLGAIGYFVDGIAMYDSRDAFSYNNANSTDSTPRNGLTGDGIWNRDAYVNESVTFDPANAHQANINHHYHANPLGLRNLLGDSVTYDATTNTYTESPNGQHSPILGWVRDGYPVYGPYGYEDALNPLSTIRRLVSGYVMRDGNFGTTDLTDTGRESLPSWAAALHGEGPALLSNQFGPDVSVPYPLGKYVEDYDYLGDLGFTQGINFDLDEHNGRFCITPEYPGGTYAYFVSIEIDGEPRHPYNVGYSYYGNALGTATNNIPETAAIYFEGGPEAPLAITEVSADSITEDLTLVWSAVEGGTYQVQQSNLIDDWEDIGPAIVSDSTEISLTDTDRLSTDDENFYRVKYTNLSAFDDNGFVYTQPTDIELTTIIVTLTSGGSPPPSNLEITPLTITYNGIAATLVSRPSQYEIEIQVDLNGFTSGDYTVSADFDGAAGVWTGDHTYAAPEHNILLIIVDDWAIDSSPVDNPTGVSLPTMANLQFLADNGLRFTNAYAQPTCSPTRAGISTGRYSFRHGIGAPGGSNLPETETALAEVISENPSYELAMYGKWHLGGGDDGPWVRGGWNEFKGILTSGVTDYYNWEKHENGQELSSVTTYATTEIAQDAINFITAQPINQKWFTWVAFNAPHSPFHEPLDVNLLQSTWDVSDTDERSLYEKALEAMDTEIGRILATVDLSTTNVILIGDNGTPNQVTQAPFTSATSKGQLYDGGTHVPLIIAGPSVKVTGVTDEPVHCVDLYSTIIAMAGMNHSDHVAVTTVVDGRSLLPTLAGQDVEDAVIVVENFGNNEPNNGRAILKDGYKLVIYDDPNDVNDMPHYEFYYLPDDENEQNDLLLSPVSEEAIAAYNSIVDYNVTLVDNNVALGDNFDAGSYLVSNVEIVYIELPNPGVPAVPNFTNANGTIDPTEILIGGQIANFISRVNSSEVADRYWVKASIDPVAEGFSVGNYNITVQFRDHPVKGTRIYNSPTVYVVD